MCVMIEKMKDFVAMSFFLPSLSKVINCQLSIDHVFFFVKYNINFRTEQKKKREETAFFKGYQEMFLFFSLFAGFLFGPMVFY